MSFPGGIQAFLVVMEYGGYHASGPRMGEPLSWVIRWYVDAIDSREAADVASRNGAMVNMVTGKARVGGLTEEDSILDDGSRAVEEAEIVTVATSDLAQVRRVLVDAQSMDRGRVTAINGRACYTLGARRKLFGKFVRPRSEHI